MGFCAELNNKTALLIGGFKKLENILSRCLFSVCRTSAFLRVTDRFYRQKLSSELDVRKNPGRVSFVVLSLYCFIAITVQLFYSSKCGINWSFLNVMVAKFEIWVRTPFFSEILEQLSAIYIQHIITGIRQYCATVTIQNIRNKRLESYFHLNWDSVLY